MRLGMLIPSSNTVVESETPALLPADGSVTMHISRLGVTHISDDRSSRDQFEPARVASAAELLADARVDAILWNGTSSGWLGFERDDELVATVEAHTGIRTTTAIIAMNAELARLGATRIALVTPYVAAIEAQIIANYAAIGIRVVSAVRSDLTENTAFAAVTPEDIAAMTRAALRTPADAAVILCTNLAGAAIAPALERECETPILDSVRVAVRHSLALIEANPGSPGFWSD